MHNNTNSSSSDISGSDLMKNEGSNSSSSMRSRSWLQSNIPDVLVYFVFTLIVLSGLGYLGYQDWMLTQEIHGLRYELSSSMMNKPVQKSDSNMDSMNEATSTSPGTSQLPFSEVLAQGCKAENIAISDLPVVFSPTFKAAYKIDTTMSCSIDKELSGTGYAESEVPVSRIDNNGNEYLPYDRKVLFYTGGSIYEGMINPLVKLSTLQKLSISPTRGYYLWLQQPGPYGASTKGMLVNIVGEEYDQTTNTYVRIIKDGVALHDTKQYTDLLKKYGTSFEWEPGVQAYYLDSTKKEAFLAELVELVNNDETFKAIGLELDRDFAGVPFK